MWMLEAGGQEGERERRLLGLRRREGPSAKGDASHLCRQRPEPRPRPWQEGRAAPVGGGREAQHQRERAGLEGLECSLPLL